MAPPRSSRPALEASSPAPTLALAVLEELEALGGAEFAEEIALIFLRDAPGRAERAAAALVEGTLRIVEREAHALCGGAGQVGALALARAARAAEGAAQMGDVHEVRRTFGTLQTELTAALAELSKWHEARSTTGGRT